MKEILEYPILELGKYVLHVYSLMYLILVLATVFLILYIIKRIIYRSKKIDNAKKFSITKLIQYIAVIISFIAGLRILGFDMTVLLAGSAALLVGLGFGLQNLFNDFISGVILLLDATIKMDDIIEVNGVIYKVQDINFRTTTVIGRNEDYVILPNSELTANKVVNWTHSRISSRFKIEIGVDYATDVDLLMKVLKEATMRHPQILQTPEPFVRFEDYGDSALLFGVFFFSDEIFRVERIKSEIRIEIFKALKENGIEIPFPQRVIHTRS
jgi:small-conductance mechanosensitive channel